MIKYHQEVILLKLTRTFLLLITLFTFALSSGCKDEDPGYQVKEYYDIVSDKLEYNEVTDTTEGVDLSDLSGLKSVFDSIGDNYKTKTIVYFNKLAVEQINKIYRTTFYCQQSGLISSNYRYFYTDNLHGNNAYFDYNGHIFKTSLAGVSLEDKLNSEVDLKNLQTFIKNNTLKDYYFGFEDLNSDYVDKYGYFVDKVGSSQFEYFGWERIGSKTYKCDRKEVLADFLEICCPGFSNQGTYMTFKYVTVEINPNSSDLLRIRLYASPTQTGKLIESHLDEENKPLWYLLFADCYVSGVNSARVPALQNINN